MGQIYTGKTCLHYFTYKKRELKSKTNIDEHIVSMKAIGNRLALLTGRGTVIIFDFDTKLSG